MYAYIIKKLELYYHASRHYNLLPGLLTTNAMEPCLPPCFRITSDVVVHSELTIADDSSSMPSNRVADSGLNSIGVSWCMDANESCRSEMMEWWLWNEYTSMRKSQWQVHAGSPLTTAVEMSFHVSGSSMWEGTYASAMTAVKASIARNSNILVNIKYGEGEKASFVI